MAKTIAAALRRERQQVQQRTQARGQYWTSEQTGANKRQAKQAGKWRRQWAKVRG